MWLFERAPFFSKCCEYQQLPLILIWRNLCSAFQKNPSPIFLKLYSSSPGGYKLILFACDFRDLYVLLLMRSPWYSGMNAPSLSWQYFRRVWRWLHYVLLLEECLGSAPSGKSLLSFHHKFLLSCYLMLLDTGIIPFPDAAFHSESKKKISFR